MGSILDDDDISLASSTWTEYRSDYGEGKDYYVDQILAEQERPNKTVAYLLQWEGYSNERATWEDEDIVPDDKIQQWNERQDRVRAQLEKPFDIEVWERDVRSTLERKEQRKQRRAAKRARLGITTKYKPGQRPVSTDGDIVDPNGHMPIDENALFVPEGLDRAHPPPESKADTPRQLPAEITNQSLKRKASVTLPAHHESKSQTLASKPQPTLPTRSVENASTDMPTRRPIAKPTNIFSRRWDDHTEPKRRGPSAAQPKPAEHLAKDPKPRKVMTLSQLNKINKASTAERPPPAFEEMQKVYDSVRSAPTTIRPKSPTAPPVAAGPSSTMSDRTWHPTESTTPSAMSFQQAPPGPANIRRGSEPAFGHSLKTCYYWAQGQCNKTAETCKFEHRYLPEFAIPPNWNGLPPRHWPGTSIPARAAAGPSAAGPSVAGPSVAGPSTSRPLAPNTPAADLPSAGPSAPRKSEPRPSAPGASATAPSLFEPLASAETSGVAAPVTKTVPSPDFAVREQLKISKGSAARLTTRTFVQANIYLHTNHPAIAALLMSTRGPNPLLSVNFTITDRIYHMFRSNNPFASVNIHYGAVSFPNTTSKLGEGLHQYRLGLSTQAASMNSAAAASIVAQKEWVMLLYDPEDAESFHHNEAEHSVGAEKQLYFQLISPLPSPHTPPTVTITDNGGSFRERFVSYIYRHFADIYSSDLKAMFEWFDGKPLDKHVFLRFEGYPQERDLLVTLLEPLVASVSTSDQLEDWSAFVKMIQPDKDHSRRGSGVVIFHPANRRFYNVPDLWKLMLSSVNFYMFGPCTDDYLDRYNTLRPIQLWKMWATGTVTMVSEDLLARHPRRAQRAVDYVVKKGVNRAMKDRTWKLFTRPNVIGWLRDKALEGRQADPQGLWRDWKVLADTINDSMCPEGYFAPGSNDPLPDATLISPTTADYETHVRIFKGPGWRSEEDVEVLYFADWAVSRAFQFRRFCVLVPEVTPQYAKLQAKWQHVEIITPEKYLERYDR